jgi:hypothetical protein
MQQQPINEMNINECAQCNANPALTTTTSNVQMATTSITEKVQPQPYPLQGQALATGWGQYPQGAYYPPPVQRPQEIREEVA